jgi:1,4-dihydroxy-2-naphthoate octaprenyltransferase
MDTEVKMLQKLKVHLWTMPRWFAFPFIGVAAIMGSVLAGGDLGNLNLWLAFAATGLIMAGGHGFNSFLDYYWTKLDEGGSKERSAEKMYCGGQSLLAEGVIGKWECLANCLVWYALAFIPLTILALDTSGWIIPLGISGMLITFWYSKSKFTYTHELALGAGCGPIPVLMGMYAIDPSPAIGDGLLVSIPFAIILSFAGLALDEWPDAKANLTKGVKSFAYEAWRCRINLSTYLMCWFSFLYTFQVFLIDQGILQDWTALTFIIIPALMANLLFVNKYALLLNDEEEETFEIEPEQWMYDGFAKAAGVFVIIAALYPILLVIGQSID